MTGAAGEQIEVVTPSSGFTFSALSKAFASDDSDLAYQAAKASNWTARKACAALKVTSAIVGAVVVHPGADCDDKRLAEVTRDLMQQASALTDAATELLSIRSDDPRYGSYRSMLRQQAAEVVSSQYRLANSTGSVPLSVERISKLYKCVIDLDAAAEHDLPVHPLGVDFVTTKRMALLGVAPEIYEAVNAFNYFAPEPERLVEKGVRSVLKASDQGLGKLITGKASDESRSMLAQSLIVKAGALYAANWKAHARRDVILLQRMEPLERMRHIHVHRQDGLPTQHIDESFDRLMRRMVDMVCEAVPELKNNQALLVESEDSPEKKAVRRFQWVRNQDTDQAFGDQQIIVPIDDAVFFSHIRDSLRAGIATSAEEYVSASGADHALLLRKSGSEEWEFMGAGQLAELAPKPKDVRWVLEVRDFGSPEAIAHGKTAVDNLPAAARNRAQPE